MEHRVSSDLNKYSHVILTLQLKFLCEQSTYICTEQLSAEPHIQRSHFTTRPPNNYPIPQQFDEIFARAFHIKRMRCTVHEQPPRLRLPMYLSQMSHKNLRSLVRLPPALQRSARDRKDNVLVSHCWVCS
jgi:hypothetical protein